jgi:signal transduction histidine kinase
VSNMRVPIVSTNPERITLTHHRNLVISRISLWAPVLLPFALGLVGSAIYAFHGAGSDSWAPVLQSLYYIPVVIAGILLGLRPALAIAVCASVAHLGAAALANTDAWLGPVAHTILFVSLALISAKVTEYHGRDLKASAGTEHTEDLLPAVLLQQVPAQSDGLDSGVLSRVLAAMVRHFRNPVTSIEGAGWVLDDAHLADDKRRELVGIIRKEAQRLTRMLSDVMEFTQPPPARLRLVNFSKVLQDVIQLESRKHGTGRWVISTNIAPELPALRADPEQLSQVLLNLIKNSTEASPDGGPIEISAVAEDEKLIFRVRDYGVGIPASAIDRIFEPFFSTRERSLGLGLPAALRIVKDHGGEMLVDSHEREGTCVSVTLPLNLSSSASSRQHIMS